MAELSFACNRSLLPKNRASINTLQKAATWAACAYEVCAGKSGTAWQEAATAYYFVYEDIQSGAISSVADAIVMITRADALATKARGSSSSTTTSGGGTSHTSVIDTTTPGQMSVVSAKSSMSSLWLLAGGLAVLAILFSKKGKKGGKKRRGGKGARSRRAARRRRR